MSDDRALREALEHLLRGRARGGRGLGFNADMHEEAVVDAILADPDVRDALRDRAERPPKPVRIATGAIDEGDVAWLLHYEDDSHRSEVWFGEGAERAARRRFEDAQQTWNCTLFRQAAPLNHAPASMAEPTDLPGYLPRGVRLDTTTIPEPDGASEYGRLLAERDRLIADGADPDDLLVPDRPTDS